MSEECVRCRTPSGSPERSCAVGQLGDDACTKGVVSERPRLLRTRDKTVVSGRVCEWLLAASHDSLVAVNTS